MKNAIVTIAVSTLVLMSCSNPVEELKQTAQQEIQSSLLDPKSFEVIETKVDTLYHSWEITQGAQKYLKYYETWMDFTNDYQKKLDWEIAFGSTSMAEFYLEKTKTFLDSANHYDALYDQEMNRASRLMNTPEDTIVGYVVDVRYYAMNRGGNRAMGDTRFYSFVNGTTRIEEI